MVKTADNTKNIKGKERLRLNIFSGKKISVIFASALPVETDSFKPEKTEGLYTYYHSMIEPYVTGENGETEGYTHLESPEDFAESLNELIEHTYGRYDAVMELISEQ